tara:strand:+ start:341 stop:916 length:576 start_codon:yes stop_codon:yes gene_type:complete
MIPLLLKKVEAKGYRIFTRGQYNLNIIGIRHRGRPNEFDDTLALVYRDEAGGWVTREFICTTDPGSYWTNNPGNVNGTAVLCPGQYKSYKIDKHQGRSDALCQRLGPVKVWRTPAGEKIEWDKLDDGKEGWYGINIHSSGLNLSTAVNKWSAGCTVLADPLEWLTFMRIVNKSAEHYGNAFTYTLLEEEDV